MHAMVRKYAGKGGLLDGLAPRVRDGLVPLLRQAPGFRSYCCFASEDGHLVSVSTFDDRPTAEVAPPSRRRSSATAVSCQGAAPRGPERSPENMLGPAAA